MTLRKIWNENLFSIISNTKCSLGKGIFPPSKLSTTNNCNPTRGAIMKQWLALVVSAAALFASIWVNFQIEDSPYNVTYSTTNNQGITASILESYTDRGHAPYGQHISLHGFGTYGTFEDGYVVFAAYCDDIQVRWQSDTLLQYSCTGMKEVATRVELAVGIRIQGLQTPWW